MPQPSLRYRLIDAFSDEELYALAWDHFRPVSQQFTRGLTKGEMVQLLLEYVTRRGEGVHFLNILEGERPGLWGNREELLRELESHDISSSGSITTSPAKPIDSRHRESPAQFHSTSTSDLAASKTTPSVPYKADLPPFVSVVSSHGGSSLSKKSKQWILLQVILLTLGVAVLVLIAFAVNDAYNSSWLRRTSQEPISTSPRGEALATTTVNPANTSSSITQTTPRTTPVATSFPWWVPQLVEVPAGPFLMGSVTDHPLAGGDDTPKYNRTLFTYWIGQTEVSNAQFRRFVEGDGYTNPEYWTVAGWEWRQQHNITEPLYWHDDEWNNDDQPVVGVSWFEAVAYTRWLSARTGHRFRLPNDAEWEKAARGTSGQIWPWGNDWGDGFANGNEANIKRTTPVGAYPAGASPYGALDMAGNAWEWCLTRRDTEEYFSYQPRPEPFSDTYLETDDWRQIRGGSWYDNLSATRWMSHYLERDPRQRYNTLGFRVASDARPPPATAP
jgi:formylglycine-generating enzyme required for sulfatase activity